MLRRPVPLQSPLTHPPISLFRRSHVLKVWRDSRKSILEIVEAAYKRCLFTLQEVKPFRFCLFCLLHVKGTEKVGVLWKSPKKSSQCMAYLPLICRLNWKALGRCIKVLHKRCTLWNPFVNTRQDASPWKSDYLCFSFIYVDWYFFRDRPSSWREHECGKLSWFHLQIAVNTIRMNTA